MCFLGSIIFVVKLAILGYLGWVSWLARALLSLRVAQRVLNSQAKWH